MIIWQPEQQINNGRFIIQGKPLGSGGFGTTYKALEPNTGKFTPLKLSISKCNCERILQNNRLSLLTKP